MAEGDVVRLVNTGDTDFHDAYNGRPWHIAAQTQTMVPYEAVCLWLGHPESNNFDPRNRVRVTEYDRLCTRYGVHARNLEESQAFSQGRSNEPPTDLDLLFKSMRPHLEAYDMAEQRIMTVADDPDGNMLSVPMDPNASDQTMILNRMQTLEQELSNMRSQLAMQQRREQALNEAQPINEDASGQPRDVAQDIPGTVVVPEDPDAPAKAPRPPSRTTPGEDTPTRVRVSG